MDTDTDTDTNTDIDMDMDKNMDTQLNGAQVLQLELPLLLVVFGCDLCEWQTKRKII
ncbi:GH14812 [Drosophila grimshawi]|uniref:GH14812 n=1 Tax=Drosophila grimshawi TaxID=7222 RepID=B4J393_DROGR|nr:GH14812 [Drosophila grimshawi]